MANVNDSSVFYTGVVWFLMKIIILNDVADTAQCTFYWKLDIVKNYKYVIKKCNSTFKNFNVCKIIKKSSSKKYSNLYLSYKSAILLK